MSLKQTPWVPHHGGDRCLILEFGDKIDKQLVEQVVALNTHINAEMAAGRLPGVLETVPTFRSLAVVFDPITIHPNELIEQLRHLEEAPENTAPQQTGQHWSIPVHYGQTSGPDLSDVAQLTGLDEEHVIQLHQQTVFTVYMLGFLPGFAFLGDTPPELHLPRRSVPRVRVPAGSVAIAMQLTGVYPWDSPGGWHILGKCPVRLFDGHAARPSLFKAGDTVQFHRVSSDEFDVIAQASAQGTFNRKTLERKEHTVNDQTNDTKTSNVPGFFSTPSIVNYRTI